MAQRNLRSHPFPRAPRQTAGVYPNKESFPFPAGLRGCEWRRAPGGHWSRSPIQRHAFASIQYSYTHTLSRFSPHRHYTLDRETTPAPQGATVLPTSFQTCKKEALISPLPTTPAPCDAARHPCCVCAEPFCSARVPCDIRLLPATAGGIGTPVVVCWFFCSAAAAVQRLASHSLLISGFHCAIFR